MLTSEHSPDTPTWERAEQPTAAGPPASRGLPWLVIVLCVVTVIPLWLCEYFPSHNGPALLAVAHIASHYSDPEFGYAAYYDVHPFPTPYLLQFGITVPLLAWFEPHLVLKVLVTFVILLRVGAVFYFLRQVGAGHAIYGLACLPLTYDFVLMRGYFNFHAAISLGLMVFGYHLQHRDRWSLRSIIIINLLTLLLYFSHPVPLAVIGILMAVYELAMTRSVLRVWGLLVRGFLPSVALLVAFVLWSRSHNAWSSAEFVFLSLPEKIQNVHYRGATPLSFLTNAASLLLLGVAGAVGLWDAVQRADDPVRRGMAGLVMRLAAQRWLVVWLCAVLLYLLMPCNLLGWHKADVHLLPFCFLLLLAVPQPLASRRARVAFSGLATAIVLLGIVPVTQGLRHASDEVREYVAGIPAVPRKGKLLSLAWFEPRADAWRLQDAFNPTQWADSYYLIGGGGGMGRGLIKYNTLYPVWFKDYREQGETQFPRVDRQSPSPAQLDRAATEYGSIVLWNDGASFRKMFEERGFTVAFVRGRLCVLTRLAATAGDDERGPR